MSAPPPTVFTIYTITNTVNGKIYVGRSKEYERRMQAHLNWSRRGDKPRHPLYNSIRKYGEEAFNFRVVAEFTDYEESLAAEKALISELGTTKRECGYNISDGGEDILSAVKANMERIELWRRDDPEGFKAYYSALNKAGCASLTLEARRATIRKAHITMGPAAMRDRLAATRATLSPADLRANAAKALATLGPEGRRARARAMVATLGPEGLSARAKKTVAAQSPEARSDARRRSWTARRETWAKRAEQIGPPPTITGAQLFAARDQLGWSRPRLAETTGVGRETIRKHETGEQPMPVHKLAKIELALAEAGVEVSAIAEISSEYTVEFSPQSLPVYRERAKLTQDALAKISGVPVWLIKDYERNARNMPDYKLAKIERALVALGLDLAVPIKPEPPAPDDFGPEEMVRRRKALSWSRLRLSEASDVPAWLILDYEHGKRGMPPRKLARIWGAISAAEGA